MTYKTPDTYRIYIPLSGRTKSTIGSAKDSNHIKSESYDVNDNIRDEVDIGNEVDIDNGVDKSNRVDISDGVDDELILANLNRTESESCNNYYNIRNIVGEEISLMEKI